MRKVYEGYLRSSDTIMNYCIDYKKAYFFLFRSIEKSNDQFDEILTPMLFLLRHSVELGFKFNIKYLSVSTKEKLKIKIYQEHNLSKLLDEFRRLLNHSKIGDRSIVVRINEYLVAVGNLTSFLSDLDKGGTSFRYNVYSEKVKNAGMFRIDLLKINELFEKTMEFLVSTSDVLDDYYKLGKPFIDEQLKQDLIQGFSEN